MLGFDADVSAGTGTARTQDAEGVRLFDQQQRFVSAGQPIELRQGGERSVDGEERVGDDECSPRVGVVGAIDRRDFEVVDRPARGHGRVGSRR